MTPPPQFDAAVQSAKTFATRTVAKTFAMTSPKPAKTFASRRPALSFVACGTPQTQFVSVLWNGVILQVNGGFGIYSLFPCKISSPSELIVWKAK